MLEKEYSKYLMSILPRMDFLSKVKIISRPFICPFSDILKIIGDGNTIFDIGCGSGTFLALCAQYLKPEKIGGIEIEEKLIKNSKKMLKDFKSPKYLALYDGINIPQTISQYNVITMIDVLHHIPEKEQISFLENLRAKMNPKARLIIKDIDGGSSLVFFNKLHDLIISGNPGNERSYEDVQCLLKEMGFRIDETYKKRVLIYPHYLVSSKYS